jgi:hypothetical protein
MSADHICVYEESNHEVRLNEMSHREKKCFCGTWICDVGKLPKAGGCYRLQATCLDCAVAFQSSVGTRRNKRPSTLRTETGFNDPGTGVVSRQFLISVVCCFEYSA